MGLLNDSASNVESLSKVIKNNHFTQNRGFNRAVKISSKNLDKTLNIPTETTIVSGSTIMLSNIPVNKTNMNV